MSSQHPLEPNPKNMNLSWVRFDEFGIPVFCNDLNAIERTKSLIRKKFSSFQVQLTRQAIENIRSIVTELYIPFLFLKNENSKSNALLVNIDILKRPYENIMPTVKDLPLWMQDQVDISKSKVAFITSHEITEEAVKKYPKLRNEFPSLNQLKIEIATLSSYEDILYGLIINGVGHAFFTAVTDPKTKAVFEKLRLDKILLYLNLIENIEDKSFDLKTINNSSRIVANQVLKLTRAFADLALQNFPEAFEDKLARNWTLSKIRKIAEVKI